MKKFFPALFFFVLFTVINASMVFAFSGIDHSRKLDGNEMNFFITKSTIEYEFDDIELDIEDENETYSEKGALIGWDDKIKRTIIGLTFGNSNGAVDIVGSLGYISDGECDDDDGLDSLGIDYEGGAAFALGGRAMVADFAPFSVHAYGQLEGTYEKWEGEKSLDTRLGPSDINSKFEVYTYDIAFGALAKFTFEEVFSVYGGLEIVPISGGQLKADIEIQVEDSEFNVNENGKGNVERKDILSFMLGASATLRDKWNLNGEATFGAEQAFSLSVGVQF